MGPEGSGLASRVGPGDSGLHWRPPGLETFATVLLNWRYQRLRLGRWPNRSLQDRPSNQRIRVELGWSGWGGRRGEVGGGVERERGVVLQPDLGLATLGGVTSHTI